VDVATDQAAAGAVVADYGTTAVVAAAAEYR
jgi:hypothetical protein